MSDIVRYESDLPELRDPLLIAGYGGAWGATAVSALRRVAERYEAVPLASIDPQRFYDFSVMRPMVNVVDGERSIEWPRNEFLLVRREDAHDIVLLIGAEPQLRWQEFVEVVTGTMEHLDVHDSLILGAYRAATPHSRPLPVQLFSRDAELAARLGLTAEDWSYEGPTGITTPLGIACEERGWRSSTLVVAAPFYVAVEPHPHAERELLRVLEQGLGLEADLGDLDEQIRTVYQEAEGAREGSEPFSQFVANLEQEYDLAHPLAAVEASVAPSAPELLEDVEAFLRQARDAGEPGSP